MSEQTPNSSESISGAEPSMEDILASIRKIISEDEPVAMESPEDVVVQPLVESAIDVSSSNISLETGLDVPAPDLKSAINLEAEGDSVDLDIDDVLAGLDIDLTDEEPATANFTNVTAPVASLLPAAAVAAVAPVLTKPSEPLADATSLLDDDILALLDDDAALAVDDIDLEIPDVPEAKALDASEVEVTSEEFLPLKDGSFTVDNDDEMDALLDDILLSSDEAVETDFDLVADEPALSEHVEPAPVEQARVETDKDLDLVKALMADLADNPGAVDVDEDLDSLLAIPDLEETALDSDESLDLDELGDLDELADIEGLEASEFDESPETETETETEAEADLTDLDETAVEDEEDILGDILDMTLEDQLQAHPDDIPLDEIPLDDGSLDEILSSDDVAEFEQINVLENTDVDVALDESIDLDDMIADDIEDDLPSLSDIAAAAEADALAAETFVEPAAFNPVLAAVGGAGVAALGAKSIMDEPSDHAVEGQASTEPTETLDTNIEHHTFQSQETTMPVKAVNTDTILNDVTETAAAGAFAQLNTVVEDKAIFNERGPRIGDLVQEALRPMLKEWLDANLKGIVERAVTKEVKRISSGK